MNVTNRLQEFYSFQLAIVVSLEGDINKYGKDLEANRREAIERNSAILRSGKGKAKGHQLYPNALVVVVNCCLVSVHVVFLHQENQDRQDQGDHTNDLLKLQVRAHLLHGEEEQDLEKDLIYEGNDIFLIDGKS